MAAVASIGMLALSAASTTYGIVKQNEAARKQEEFQAQQSKQQEAMFNEQRQAEAQMRAEKEKMDAESEMQEMGEQKKQDRDSAKARQRKLAMGAYGRSDTILTGPQGIVEEPEKKTILGV